MAANERLPPLNGQREQREMAAHATIREQAGRRDNPLRTDVWLEFGDGVYRFQLRLKDIIEVERLCNHPLPVIYGNVAAGRYELDGKSVAFATEGRASPVDLRHVVRLALTGGGIAKRGDEIVPVSAEDATRLTGLYLDPSSAPAMKGWDLAFVILDSAIMGRTSSEVEREHGLDALVPPGFDHPVADLDSSRRVSIRG